jgi:chromosome segregation ATPase
MAATTHSSSKRATAKTARAKKTRSAAGSGTKKKSGSRSSSSSSSPKVPATPAGKSLDRAQHALDRATKTEKQLRTSLKKHTREVRAVQADLDQRGQDLKTMKSQLKAAKKSRKQAAKAVQI